MRLTFERCRGRSQIARQKGHYTWFLIRKKKVSPLRSCLGPSMGMRWTRKINHHHHQALKGSICLRIKGRREWMSPSTLRSLKSWTMFWQPSKIVSSIAVLVNYFLVDDFVNGPGHGNKPASEHRNSSWLNSLTRMHSEEQGLEHCIMKERRIWLFNLR